MVSYYQINSEGKFLVFFNGSVVSCTENSDCPGIAHCYVNVSWSAFPSMCACSVTNGIFGNDCNQFSHWGGLLFTIYFFCVLISSFVFLVGLYDFVFLHKEIARRPFTAFSTTLIFNMFAAFSLVGYASDYLAAAYGKMNMTLQELCAIGTFLFLR